MDFANNWPFATASKLDFSLAYNFADLESYFPVRLSCKLSNKFVVIRGFATP